MNDVALVSSVRPPRGPLTQDRVCSRSLRCACALGDRQWRHRSSSYLSDSDSSLRVSAKSRYACLVPRLDSLWKQSQFRLYSSKGDGKNTSEEKDVAKFDSHAHARLADLDQKEWFDNERLAMESNKNNSPFLTRREKFMSEFMRRIVPWEKIHISWDNFPYYINEQEKRTLVECATAHLKHKQLSGSHGARLASSSGRILLQSVPGTMLYQERIVRALARDLQVPLLILHSSVLAPHNFSDHSSERESDDNAISRAETLESADENDEDVLPSSNEMDDDGDGLSINEIAKRARTNAAFKYICSSLDVAIADMEKRLTEEVSRSPQSLIFEPAECKLKKGDYIKYIGQGSAKRNISAGQRGIVFEVRGDEVAVRFGAAKDNKEAEGESERNSKEHMQWVHVKEIKHDPDNEVDDCYIAIEALSEILGSVGPLIVHFPDFSNWMSKAVPKSEVKDFVHKVEQIFDRLSGPAVLICGQGVTEMGSKEKEIQKAMLLSFEHLAKLVFNQQHLGRSDDDNLFELFTNVLSLSPPKEEQLRSIFNMQIKEDRKIITSRYNLNQLKRVLDENNMSCLELLNVITDGVVLTEKKAERAVGWAKNHHLSNCSVSTVSGGCLVLPRESLEIAILRLKEQETISQKQAPTAQNLKSLASDEYEAKFISAVVPPAEIGVKFDDVGALEDVKTALNELVILPMRRPELFTRGNLLRPCKGLLLFGPPGTGKTLVAKALAAEAGASFMSITGSSLTSKWFGETEKLTKAVFSFASKLAPVVIFIDEVDSLLGARGRASEHEATRSMKNEFMAAWDGLRSKDSQRVLVLGATNRPFDLDDAVIRRLPRRIYVDLPDASNRLKILKIMLAQENLEPGFQFEALADATDGYSGSDLKNLCIAAAYRPVQEFLEEELKGAKGNRTLRSLKVDDFIQSKSKVGPSVSNDASSMNDLKKWNDEYGEGGSRKRSPFGFTIR